MASPLLMDAEYTRELEICLAAGYSTTRTARSTKPFTRTIIPVTRPCSSRSNVTSASVAYEGRYQLQGQPIWTVAGDGNHLTHLGGCRDAAV